MNEATRIPAGYYTAQVGKLPRCFDRAAKHYRPVLAAHLAGEPPDEIPRETRQEFEGLLPAIPYIGGKKNSLIRILIGCATSLALHRVLKGCGISAEEVGRIVVEIEERRVHTYPRFLVRLAEGISTRPWGSGKHCKYCHTVYPHARGEAPLEEDDGRALPRMRLSGRLDGDLCRR